MSGAAEVVRGEVVETRILGDDFWGTTRVRTADGMVTAVGKLVAVAVGETVALTGTWAVHPRYGRQFKFRAAEVLQPTSASGVVAWLRHRLPAVGHGRAVELVERFGPDGVFDVLEGDGRELLEVRGITPERRDAILESYWQHRAERDRMVRLKGWGLTDGQIGQLTAAWGDEVEERLRANPYAAIEQVRGFGFARADAVAQRMGLAADAPARIRAGLLHQLKVARERGHTYVPAPKLVAMAARLLEVSGRPVWDELVQMRDRGDVVGGKGRARLPGLSRAERDVAERVSQMLAGAAQEGEAA